MNARSPGGAAGARCPVCGRPSAAPTRPFCGVRCADVDLGRWLTGQYRIPAEAGEADAEEVPREPEPDPDAA